MKSKHLLLATLLLSQTAPVWGMNGMNDDVAQDRGVAAPHRAAAANQPLPIRGAAAVALLRNKIQNMENAVDQTLATARVQAPNFYDKKVFVIGETGHGKTTLLHAIAGVPFNIVANGNGRGRHLEVPDGRRLPGTQLGHGRVVGTIAPAVVPDHGRQTVFVDCLGFGDPRGPVLDTANALGIKRLFEQGTRAKALLVVEEDKLATLRDDFVPRLLNQVAASFPDDQMLNSIRLVVTKATADYLPRVDLKDWKRHDQMGDRAKLLIDSLLQPDRIFKFLAPTNAQRFDGFDVNEFSRILGQDGYTLNPSVRPVLTAASKLLIGDMVDEIRETGRRYLEGEASNRIETLCEDKINDLTDPNRKIKALRADLRTLRGDIRSLLIMHHFKDRLHHIIGDNDVSGRRVVGQPHLVGGLVQNVEFLQELYPTVNTPQDAWHAALAPITGSIETLAADPQINAANGILSIKGRLAAMKDLKKWKKAHPATNITLAKIFASNATFADADIQQENCSIAIYSPKLNVPQPTIINVSGSSGDPGTIGGVGGAGTNGAHGTPGSHFLAKIGEANGLANFTVSAQGGNGGNGGDGGDGARGANGNLDHAVHTQTGHGLLPYGWGCRNDGGFSAEGHWIRSDDLRHQLDLRYTQVLYNAQGALGSAGGNGGQGGQGAPGGSARIVGVAWASPAANVTAGNSGAHGHGGAAGFNGHSCRGEDHISRQLAYQALVGHDGWFGPGLYQDGFIDLPNKTVATKQHVGGGATAAGVTPITPHGNVPAAIPAIDEAALDAEYARFHTAERANQEVRRFVRDLP